MATVPIINNRYPEATAFFKAVETRRFLNNINSITLDTHQENSFTIYLTHTLSDYDIGNSFGFFSADLVGLQQISLTFDSADECAYYYQNLVYIQLQHLIATQQEGMMSTTVPGMPVVSMQKTSAEIYKAIRDFNERYQHTAVEPSLFVASFKTVKMEGGLQRQFIISTYLTTKDSEGTITSEVKTSVLYV